MSYYRISDGPDPNVGIDIDGQVYGDNDEYGDYEVLTKPNLSGGSFVIPENQDMGIPTEYRSNDYRTEYRMNQFLESDQRGGTMLSSGNDSFSGRLYREILDEESVPIEDVKLNETFNGRVSDANEIKDTILPQSNQDIIINKDYQDTSIKGMLEKNAVNDIFFSDINMQAVNDSIRYGVHQKTSETISKQSQNELYGVMRSILLQYANFQTSADNIIDEIKRLNSKVILYCVENISSNVIQHKGYVNDLTKLPEPIMRPQMVEKQNYTYDISNLL